MKYPIQVSFWLLTFGQWITATDADGNVLPFVQQKMQQAIDSDGRFVYRNEAWKWLQQLDTGSDQGPTPSRFRLDLAGVSPERRILSRSESRRYNGTLRARLTS